MLQGERVAVIPEHIGLHQHVALIYARHGEQHGPMAGFLAEGIRNNQFCFHVHDESTPASVLRALSAAGVDTDRALAEGRLALADKSTSFLAGGGFQPAEMLKLLEGAVTASLAAGLAGVRAAGEMCWALGSHPGAEQVMTYEALCNGFIEQHPVAGLCMYNRARFDDASIRHAILTHPFVMIEGTLCRNFYHVAPEQYLGGEAPDLDVDQILTAILRREVAERSLVATELAIEGDLVDTARLADARRLAGIYRDLVVYKEELLERNRTRVRSLGTRAGIADRTSVTRQEGELDAVRQRLEFWEGCRQQLIGIDFDAEQGTVHYLSRSVRLSRRESQLLRALMSRHGRSVRARELVLRAWGSDELSEAQLRSYVVQLRKKLALIELPASLVNQPGSGYSMIFDPAPLTLVGGEPVASAV